MPVHIIAHVQVSLDCRKCGRPASSKQMGSPCKEGDITHVDLECRQCGRSDKVAIMVHGVKAIGEGPGRRSGREKS